MKYLGEHSVSSFFSKIFGCVKYLVLAGAIGGSLFFAFIFFSSPEYAPKEAGVPYYLFQFYHEILSSDSGWQTVRDSAWPLRVLLLIYFIFVMAVLYQVISQTKTLFDHFRKNMIFTQKNVALISRIGKLLLVYSAMTVNLSSVFVSLLLLILCEIFKNGTALQEEHDLTV